MNDYLDRVMLGFAAFFVVFMTFSGGIRVGEHDYLGGITDLFLAIFFLAILGAVLLGKLKDLRDKLECIKRDTERHRQMGEKMAKDLISALDEAFGNDEDKPLSATKKATHKRDKEVISKSQQRRMEISRMHRENKVPPVDKKYLEDKDAKAKATHQNSKSGDTKAPKKA